VVAKKENIHTYKYDEKATKTEKKQRASVVHATMLLHAIIQY